MKKVIFAVLILLCFATLFGVQPTQLSAQSTLLPRVRSVELSAAELAELGVDATATAAEYREIRNGEEKRIVLMNEIFDAKDLRAKDTRKNPAFAPRLAVMTSSRGSSAYFRQIEDFEAARRQDSTAAAISQSYSLANGLVSVHFQISPKAGKKQTPSPIDVYLWYEPTDEFVEKLPERYKEKIQEEKTNPQPDEPQFRQVNNPTTFSLSIYPNPATSGVATLRINSEAAHDISITVSDINGNVALPEQRSEQIREGDTQISISIDGLAAGMYIVTVQSPDGARISERLIVIH